MNHARRERLLATWSAALLATLGLAGCDKGQRTEPESETTRAPAETAQATAEAGTSGPDRAAAPTSDADRSESAEIRADGTAETAIECGGVGQPEVVLGQPSGLCRDGGLVHRAAAVECPREARTGEPVRCGGDASECQSDFDCVDGSREGHCELGMWGGCYCSYGCVTDASCGDGLVCECGSPTGRCVPAGCSSDAECEGELLCTRYDSMPWCGSTRYDCQTPDDTCASNADCNAGDACAMDDGQRACVAGGCVIGRPFLVDGEERLAPLVERGDWLASLEPIGVADLGSALRARLAEHWALIGLMEHASVAAFARSALQLMQLGAPPALLVDTQQAMLDETEHARLCFGVARAYGGTAYGPGELELEGAFEPIGLVDILALVIEEGCIGETTAALEAAESAELARDPVVAAVLRKIAADEQRHAALAWATLQWALETGGAAVREALAEAFAEALESARGLAPEQMAVDRDEAALLRHGVFTDRLRAGVRRDVVAQVVEPTFRALWASTEARPSNRTLRRG